MSSFIPFTSEADVISISHGLVNRTLAKSKWTHAAHFAAALWLMEQGRSSTLPAVIRAYNEAVGVANTDSSGYHETITQASMRAARAFRVKHKDRPVFQVCNELMASSLGHSDWLLVYWARDVLFSTEPRRHWVEPNLRPLLL